MSRYLSRAGVIAALYFVLTVAPLLSAISFGPIQFRISEALTVLAYFEPAAIPGLWIGAAAANAYASPFGLIDVVFGGGLTLVAAYLTWLIKRPAPALLPPVILNGLGVAFMLKYLVAGPLKVKEAFIFVLGAVTVGEAVVIYGLGLPLLMLILRSGVFVRPELRKKIYPEKG